MPNRLRLNNAFLQGPRMDMSVHVLERQRGGRQEVIEQVMVDGNLLNIPESVIYHALTRLRISFTAQPLLGEGRALGGAMPDFIVHDGYNVALEYNGPWHETYEGKVRDFWRKVAHEARGLTRIALEVQDVTRADGSYSISTTIGSLRRVLGNPYTSSAMSIRR